MRNAQAAHAGQGGGGPDAGSSDASGATLPNGVTEADIQKQIAAALSAVLRKIQSEIGVASSVTSTT